MSSKVAVIGLDGMAWHLLSKLFKYGAMPALKRVTKNSVRGVLESTIPPFTPPAWTSVASGVNPGKHGVFDFTRLTKNYETRVMTSHDVYYPRLHEMVALKGLKSVCINQPLTYPLTRLKNTMVITDWIGPRVCCHPKSLEKYKQWYEPYASDLKAPLNENFLSLMYENAKKRVDVVNLIMKQQDWDLFWVIYSEPDIIFHYFYDSVLSGKKAVLKIFKKLDETIEKAAERSDLLVIASDHGLSKYKYAVFPNSFLEHLGLISKTHKKFLKEIADFRHVDAEQNTPPTKSTIYTRLPTETLRKIVKKVYEKVTGNEVELLYYVDSKNSKAFLMTGQGIYVKENVLVRIIESKLRKLSGILQVWTREKIYTGPYVDKAPHILFTYDEGYTTGSALIVDEIISKRITYGHHPDGIIIVYGRGVNPKQIERIGTSDVVPTILNYLGLPLPKDTDGKHISGVPVKEVTPKNYNYLNHWRLTKKISSVKRNLVKKTVIKG